MGKIQLTDRDGFPASFITTGDTTVSRVIDMQIIESSSKDDFCQQIITRLSQGWEEVGDFQVKYFPDQNGWVYFQKIRRWGVIEDVPTQRRSQTP